MKVELKVNENYLVFEDVRDSDAATLALIERLARNADRDEMRRIRARELDRLIKGADYSPTQDEAEADVHWILKRADMMDLRAMSQEKLKYLEMLMNPLAWKTVFSEKTLTDEFVAEWLVPAARKLIKAYDAWSNLTGEKRKAWERLLKVMRNWTEIKGAYPTIEDPFVNPDDETTAGEPKASNKTTK